MPSTVEKLIQGHCGVDSKHWKDAHVRALDTCMKQEHTQNKCEITIKSNAMGLTQMFDMNEKMKDDDSFSSMFNNLSSEGVTMSATPACTQLMQCHAREVHKELGHYAPKDAQKIPEQKLPELKASYEVSKAAGAAALAAAEAEARAVAHVTAARTSSASASAPTAPKAGPHTMWF